MHSCFGLYGGAGWFLLTAQVPATETGAESTDITQLLVIWAIVTGLLLAYTCLAWFRFQPSEFKVNLQKLITRETFFTLGLSSLAISSVGVLIYKLISLPTLRILLGLEGCVALIFGAFAFFWDAMEQLGKLQPKGTPPAGNASEGNGK